MFNLLSNVFDSRFVLDEIYGNNINKNTITIMYGKKNYIHQSIHGSSFLVMIKTMTFLSGHIH